MSKSCQFCHETIQRRHSRPPVRSSAGLLHWDCWETVDYAARQLETAPDTVNRKTVRFIKRVRTRKGE